MMERFPAIWQPVGLVRVPTLSRRVKDMALGAARRAGMPSSRPLAVPPGPRRSAAVAVEEEDEEQVVTSGSDVSIKDDE